MFTCICIDPDDPPEFVDTRIVTARKSHVCCECSSTIPAGARYERASGKWDGYMQTFKTCMTCRAIRNDFMQCGWNYGMLWEDIRGVYWGYSDDDDDDDDSEDWLEPN
jgi:hypothetical protein